MRFRGPVRWWVTVFAVGLGASPSAVAQTVGDLAARGECSTAGTEGVNEQLLRDHLCRYPGAFVELDHPGLAPSSGRVYPMFTAEAHDRIAAVADMATLEATSAFRTLAQQYVLYASGGCAEAARPGSSNHESGRAIDLSNWSAVRDAMLGAGCTHPLPDTDPVHFECGGPDMRMNSVLTFQRLWNVNNPGDPIAEDGLYGPQTEARLTATPAAGFAMDGCEPPDGGMVEPADGGMEWPGDGGALGTGTVTRLPDGGCACRASGRDRSPVPSLGLLVGLALGLARRRGIARRRGDQSSAR